VDQTKPENQGLLRSSKNAVLIQIWNALIALLLLVWVKFKTKAGWGLLELTRLAQPRSWNAWICGRYSVFDHQTTDNLCYSINLTCQTAVITIIK